MNINPFTSWASHLEMKKTQFRFSDRIKILVVDDDPVCIMMVLEKLQGTDFEIITGNKAYSSLLGDVDFALIDFELNNGYTGDYLGRACKARGISYAYLSEAGEPEHSVDKGANWLSKGISSEELLKVIVKTLKKKGKIHEEAKTNGRLGTLNFRRLCSNS